MSPVIHSPEVSKKREFQYLKDGGLTDDQREELLTKLSDEFDDIIDKFSSLAYQTLQSLNKSSKNPGDLYTLLKPSLPKNAKILEHFKTAKTFQDIFNRNYWSFFDYRLLALVIENCCIELNGRLADYVTVFNAYCHRRVSEVPTAFTSFSGKHFIIRVKLASEFNSLTMKDVEELEARLSKITKTDLRLLKFEPGSIVVVFSSLNEDDMLPLSEIQKCELFQLSTSILKLYSDSHVYFDRDEYTRETNLQSLETQLGGTSTIYNPLHKEDLTSARTDLQEYEPSHEGMQ